MDFWQGITKKYGRELRVLVHHGLGGYNGESNGKENGKGNGNRDCRVVCRSNRV